MRRQTEEWHPAGIQVAGEKKIKIESRRRQQKHGVLLRCVYRICAWWEQFSHSGWILE